MEKDNKEMIEVLTKIVEREQRWIEDAEERDDWCDVAFYQGKKHLANELLIMLGGKWIE